MRAELSPPGHPGGQQSRACRCRPRGQHYLAYKCVDSVKQREAVGVRERRHLGLGGVCRKPKRCRLPPPCSPAGGLEH